MKVYRVIEVEGGIWHGDREMVEITDEMILAEFHRTHGEDVTSDDAALGLKAVKETPAEWVIEEDD